MHPHGGRTIAGHIVGGLGVGGSEAVRADRWLADEYSEGSHSSLGFGLEAKADLARITALVTG